MGIDPSSAAINIAKKLWGLKLEVGYFENYEARNSDKYNLVILTHVLEHLYDPTVALEKIRRILDPNGYLFIEVPALLQPDCWPAGYFTFEHLNYFSMRSLMNILDQCGYQIVDKISIIARSMPYPVMSLVASLSEVECATKCFESDYEEAVGVCCGYIKRDYKKWQRIDTILTESLTGSYSYSCKKVVIWGAGIHTSQLFARTGILEYRDVDFIVDSDPQKWGLKLGRLEVRNPNEIQHGPGLTIVISSCASEKEIYHSIAYTEEIGTRIIRLYS